MTDSPAVSILIPAYNPAYFASSLESAMNQSFSSFEVVVRDDCPTDAIERIVRDVAAGDARVRYIRNDPPGGPFGNYLLCLESARGTYSKYLNDDDVLACAHVSTLASWLDEHPESALVTGRRTCIDSAGRAVGAIPSVQPLHHLDLEIESRSIISLVMTLRLNLIGEPSAALFRTDVARAVTPSAWMLEGRRLRGIGDLVLWVNLLERGTMGYVAAPLTQYRLHGGQWQGSAEVRAAVPESWQTVRRYCRERGLWRVGAAIAMRARAGSQEPFRTFPTMSFAVGMGCARAKLARRRRSAEGRER